MWFFNTLDDTAAAAAAAAGGDGVGERVYDTTFKCSARFAWLFGAVNMYNKIVLHKIINCISKRFFSI